jgi:hypothetical protein
MPTRRKDYQPKTETATEAKRLLYVLKTSMKVLGSPTGTSSRR